MNRWAYKLALLYNLNFLKNTQRLQFFVFFIRCKVYLLSTSPTGLSCGDTYVTTKVHLVKAMVFPVVMYGCESWTIKKAECRRTDAFELWCRRRPLLSVPWTARRSIQSILKETSPGCSLEGLMLKLKLQYFGHLMWRSDSLEKTQMLGKIEGRRRGDNRGWDGWMASLTRWTWVEWTPGVGNVQGGLACCDPWGHKESVVTEWLNWTDWVPIIFSTSDTYLSSKQSF